MVGKILNRQASIKNADDDVACSKSVESLPRALFPSLLLLRPNHIPVPTNNTSYMLYATCDLPFLLEGDGKTQNATSSWASSSAVHQLVISIQDPTELLNGTLQQTWIIYSSRRSEEHPNSIELAAISNHESSYVSSIPWDNSCHHGVHRSTKSQDQPSTQSTVDLYKCRPN